MNTNTFAEELSVWQVLGRGLRKLRWSGVVVEFGFMAVAAGAGGWAVSRAAAATAAAYEGQPLGGVPFMALGIAAVVIIAALLMLVEVHELGSRDEQFGMTTVVAGSAAAALATGIITFVSVTWLFTVQVPVLMAYFTGERASAGGGPALSPGTSQAALAAALVVGATAWWSYTEFKPTGGTGRR